MDIFYNLWIFHSVLSAFLASDNYENEDLLYDNTATLSLPVKYGVDLTVHG